MAKKTSDSDQPEDKQDTGKKSAAKKTATPKSRTTKTTKKATVAKEKKPAAAKASGTRKSAVSRKGKASATAVAKDSVPPTPEAVPVPLETATPSVDVAVAHAPGTPELPSQFKKQPLLLTNYKNPSTPRNLLKNKNRQPLKNSRQSPTISLSELKRHRLQ